MINRWVLYHGGSYSDWWLMVNDDKWMSNGSLVVNGDWWLVVNGYWWWDIYKSGGFKDVWGVLGRSLTEIWLSVNFIIMSYGGFHSHGDTPIAGWFLSGKNPVKMRMINGVPPFQETSICFLMFGWFQRCFREPYLGMVPGPDDDLMCFRQWLSSGCGLKPIDGTILRMVTMIFHPFG